MAMGLFDSVKGNMIHYFICPDDNFILNTLEKLDASTYLYRLLREEGYQQIFFIDIKETNYAVLTYDQFSYWATAKPLEFSQIDLNDTGAVSSFLGETGGTARKPTGLALNTRFNRQPVSQTAAQQVPAQKKVPAFGKSQLQTFASEDEFVAFMLNRVSPAINSDKVKTAVVMPLEMFELTGHISQTGIDKVVINTIRNAQKNNQNKSNIIVMTTTRRENLTNCMDIPNFRDLHYWVPVVLRTAGYQDDRVELAVDYLQKEGILVLADSICDDEIANLLFRKKLIDCDCRLNELRVSKIYHLAELLAEQCRMERKHFHTFTPFKMYDYIRQLEGLLSRDSVVEELVAKSRELKIRTITEQNRICAVELERITHRRIDRYVRSQEEVLADYREAMLPLNNLIGLGNVKRSIEMYLNSVLAFGGKDGPGHFIFAGSPGTGKTEVARRMSDVFKALGLLKKGHLVECRKADLVAEHVGGSAIKTKKKCTEALDGVLFVDEAYELVNLDTAGAKFKSAFDEEAYTEIMTFMENNRHRICVIFAGYTKEMKQFVKANPGMERRIAKVIDFPDYNAEELYKIFELFVGKDESGFAMSEGFSEEIRKIIQKIAKHPDPNFGNAGAMRKMFEKCKDQAAERYMTTGDESSKYLLLPQDIPEEYLLHASEEDLKMALQELNELIGLANVKNAVNELVSLKRIYEDEQGPGHYVFTGNPGTGKTEVARKMGKIFKAMGLLSRGHVVECNEADLVGEYTGQTATKVRGVCEQALGGVLFVDEAYRLVNTEPTGQVFKSSFAEEAYTEIMTFMENNRHRVSVIFAGYADLMNKFLDANDGMRSRANNIIDFPDYTNAELLQILKFMAVKEGYSFAPGFDEAALEAVAAKKLETAGKFANAREMRNLLAAFRKKVSVRMNRLYLNGQMENVEQEKYLLTPEDTMVGSRNGEREDISVAMEDLNALIGLENVKTQVRRIKNRIQYSVDPGAAIEPGHYVFAGNPGTGKTEVARLMGRIFKSLGVLSRGHVVEVSRSDLVAGYIGQTAIKTMDRCREALGGILFVDEAYTLFGKYENDFGHEALDTILKFMEDNRKKLCVIFAGYEDRMQELMEVNAGFDSRIKATISFKDYSREELTEILRFMARRSMLECTEEFVAESGALLDHLRGQKKGNFGNAREVRKLLESADERRADRIGMLIENGVAPDSIQRNLLTVEDLDLSYKQDDSREREEEPKALVPEYRRIPESTIKDLNPYMEARENWERIQLAAATDPAVLFVHTDRGEGTAFLISPDGYAITCNHVIDGAKEIYARFRMPGRPGQEDSWHKCQLINTKADLDIALLKLEGGNFPYLTLAPRDRAIRKGENFLLSGYPFGRRTEKDLTTFFGYVASSERQTDENGFVRYNINSEAKSGNSGAPIIAMSDGCVIGILLGSMNGKNRDLIEEINYMRPIWYFWEEFLEETTV